MTAPRQFSMIDKFWRTVRYRLHIPMLRNKATPEHIARGVMIGMIWAMTPFFGFHMALVFITWIVATRVFGWDFCLVNGLAWTWTTNIVTIVPAYYLFYLTGQILMGNFSDPLGYEAFHSLFVLSENQDADIFTTLAAQLEVLWKFFGIPLFMGSAVWAVVSGWLSYKLSYGFVRRYQEHRARRMAKAAKKPEKRSKFKPLPSGPQGEQKA